MQSLLPHSEVMAIDLRDIVHDPAKEGAFSPSGELQVLPVAFWERFSQVEITAFCVQHGCYYIPTMEFCAFLKVLIGNASVIEIGSGNGVMAKHMGIRATDNRMQERPEIRMLYDGLGQTPVPYGEHVECLTAIEAVRKYKPQVTLAAWVTHRFSEAAPDRGGNAQGIFEHELLEACKTYVHIGHTHTHRLKPLLTLPHRTYNVPGMVSRAFTEGQNEVWVWGAQLPGEELVSVMTERK